VTQGTASLRHTSATSDNGDDASITRVGQGSLEPVLRHVVVARDRVPGVLAGHVVSFAELLAGEGDGVSIRDQGSELAQQ
jgi:hypothetical protein